MTERSVAWQENKSQSERIRYVFENEIATDVCFEFCSQEGSSTLVRAHKIFLVTASPFFEAMFCGGMVEARSDTGGTIKIPDIDTETFKEMLRFNCNLTLTIEDGHSMEWKLTPATQSPSTEICFCTL